MPPPSQNPPRRGSSTGASPAVRRASTTGSRALKPKPKVVVISGPATGQEFQLEGDEMAVGRSSDCAISLADTSVSRRHSVLRKTEGGWAVSDLGSGNGTLLNGEAIADEMLLKNSDVISLGDTELKYVEIKQTITGVRPPSMAGRSSTGSNSLARKPVRTSRHDEASREAKSAQRRKLLMLAGLASVMLLGVGVAAKVAADRQAIAAAASAARQREVLAGFAQRFQEARALINQGKFDEAKTILVDLHSEAPDYDADNVETYIKRCDTELPNEKFLAEAQAALAARDIARAFEALSKVSAGTVQKQKREDVSSAFEALVEERIREARLMAASTGTREATVSLKELSQAILLAQPDNREVQLLKRAAEDALAKLDNHGGPVRSLAGSPLIAIRDRYRQGDMTGALLLARQCTSRTPDCKRIEEDLGEMQGKLNSLDGKGLDELRTLHRKDLELGGGSPSELAKALRVRLATALFQHAAKHKTSQQWVKAIDVSREALRVDPMNVGAKQLLDDGRSHARNMFLQCYTSKDTQPDEALRLCQEVLEIAPHDDENYIKAKKLIDELKRR